MPPASWFVADASSDDGCGKDKWLQGISLVDAGACFVDVKNQWQNKLHLGMQRVGDMVSQPLDCVFVPSPIQKLVSAILGVHVGHEGIGLVHDKVLQVAKNLVIREKIENHILGIEANHLHYVSFSISNMLLFNSPLLHSRHDHCLVCCWQAVDLWLAPFPTDSHGFLCHLISCGVLPRIKSSALHFLRH